MLIYILYLEPSGSPQDYEEEEEEACTTQKHSLSLIGSE